VALDLQRLFSNSGKWHRLVSHCSETPGKTVLVVEDDRLFRTSLCELLGSFGIEAEPVADAQQAIRALRAKDFDAVITDLDIPGSGSTVLRYARALRPETPVIILTGLPPNRMHDSTAFRRLCKPASAGEIRNALDAAFDERSNDGGE